MGGGKLEKHQRWRGGRKIVDANEKLVNELKDGTSTISK